MKDKWRKEGLIYACNIFGTGYAQIPFIDPLSDSIWRIYYSTRNENVISYPLYIDVEADNPKNILKVYDKPILEPGDRGTFDDSGVTASSIVDFGDKKYLYYIGWNKRVSVSYALNIGIAVSEDRGNSFRKMFKGAILDRSRYDPIFATAPCVIRDGSVFSMWYVSCLRWDIVDGRTEPVYVIKHASSLDGVDWILNSDICIDSSYPGEALGRPWVIKDNGIYKMWFSTRGSQNYRQKDGQHYAIVYASSINGINWIRDPAEFALEPSQDGWDSEMMEYCSVHIHKNKRIMLYNGNSFGKTGFGMAIKYET